MSKKKTKWGGKRKGAGRPKGSGDGPSPNSRRNRVAVMLSDTEWNKLLSKANKANVPMATMAYRLVSKSL